MPIPSVPNDLLPVLMDDAPAIFVGLELAPTFGAWLAVTGDLDADAYHAYGRELCMAYAIQTRNLVPTDEYGIMDTSGFGGLRPRSIEEALVLSEVRDELEDKWPAFEAWCDHRGYAYTVYEGSKLRDAWSIAEEFESDFLGFHESEEAYAQERLGEMWDNTFDMQTRKDAEGISTLVFNHMNWSRLAGEFETDDVYYGERTENGIPVFWRN